MILSHSINNEVGAGVLVFDDEGFFRLQRKWYDRLEKKGFSDIEKVTRNRSFLSQYHSHYFFRHHTPEDIESTQAYYRMCQHFYWNYKAFKRKEKKIWGLHSDGLSHREIMEQTERSYWSIQNMIARLRKIMHSGSWPSSEGASSDC